MNLSRKIHALRLLTAGAAVWLSAFGSAQTPLTLEYFLDADRGVGSATAVAAAEGDNALTIPLEGVGPGAHLLSVRAKDADGRWSPTATHLIYVCEASSLSALEYFVDTDPGEGNATDVSGFTSNGAAFAVPTGSLATGAHTLSVRGMGADGAWGALMTRTFIVTANTLALEWFYDSDPGVGLGNQVEAEEGVNVVMLDPSSLAAGVHLLSFRSRDTAGNWSPTATHPIYVVEPVEDFEKAEYFVDTDPGEGNATAVTLSADGNSAFAVPTGDLAEGTHSLTFRAATPSGRWISLFARPFVVSETNGIMEVTWKMGFDAVRTPDGLTLHCADIPDGSKIEVYNTDGLLLHSSLLPAGTDTLSLPLAGGSNHAGSSLLAAGSKLLIVRITSPTGHLSIRKL